MSSTETRDSLYVRDRLASVADGAVIVVFDLEYTSWEGAMKRNWSGEGEYTELVQIGAVKLVSRSGLPEVACFEQLSFPVFNPVLSQYFTDLTGISNEDLAADGVPFAECAKRFERFVAGASIVAANGEDADCLALNCLWRSVAMPFQMSRYLNVRPLFMAVLGLSREEMISSHLPYLLAFEMPGGAHTGLGDARAIAQGLRKVINA